MIGQSTLLLGTILSLATGPCSLAEETDASASPAAAWTLQPLEQDINVEVRVPAGTNRFAAAGNCDIAGGAINAEGYSDDGMFGIDVTKDFYSGLVVFFTNNQDEWEGTFEANEDDSVIEGNWFRFKGRVKRNYDESDTETLEFELVCPLS